MSLGDGLRSVVVERWARQIARGGAVTHEHYPASDASLDALSRSGIDTLWVQVRDPRDAAYSAWQMRRHWFSTPDRQSAETDLNDRTAIRKFTELCLELSEWVDGWISAAENPDHRPRIEFVEYHKVTRDLPCTLKRMLGAHYDDQFDAKVRDHIDRLAGGEVTPRNFRKGEGGEWRNFISPEVQAEIYGKISDRTKRLLNLAP